MQIESLICMYVNVFMFYNNIFPVLEIAYLGFFQEYIHVLKSFSFTFCFYFTHGYVYLLTYLDLFFSLDM